MLQLFANLSAEQANICSLVLSSTGIVHRIRRDPHGWAVWVREQQYEAASRAMEDYFRENQQNHIPQSPGSQTESHPQLRSNARFAEALFAAVFLMVWHLAFDWAGSKESVIRDFGASAEAIMDGQVYRAVTALMVHADAAHLAGNMLGITVFGAAVAAETGWGLGWLMILISGIAGNMLNAGMYGSGHLSIGASTAVFGAIGILAGYQVARRFQSRRRGLVAWAPLAGGLALLGFIGSGERVDIMAHFFGFAAGIVMGGSYVLLCRFKPGHAIQGVSLALVLAIVLFAWVLGAR